MIMKYNTETLQDATGSDESKDNEIIRQLVFDKVWLVLGLILNIGHMGFLTIWCCRIPSGASIRPLGLSSLVLIFAILMFTIGLSRFLQTCKRSVCMAILVFAVYLAPLPAFVLVMKIMGSIMGFHLSE